VSIQYTPIGTVRSPFKTPDAVGHDPDAEGMIILDDAYAAGLDGLTGFSHAVVLADLDQSEKSSLSARPPHADDVEVGVFATRSPHRPNGIAETVVEIRARDSATLSVRGIDLVDGTPVLDVKPYVPRVAPADVETGWVTETE